MEAPQNESVVHVEQSTFLSYKSCSSKDKVCPQYQEKTLNGTFNGRLKSDGTPDYRCRENRIPGVNKDGTRDRRYKK